MDNFERCQKIVAVAEGVDNFNIIDGKPVLKPKSRNDTGGPTRMGITVGALSKAYSQGLVEHADITKLTADEVNRIYKANYWKPSRADKMQWGLCLVHYDCAINCGVGGAGKQLQRALREIGQAITIDGIIGPMSLEAISNMEPESLISAYLNTRAKFYHGLVAKNPSQGNFLNGWLNRLERIRKAVI